MLQLVRGFSELTSIPGRADKDYVESFGWAEEELITASRNMGLSAQTVRRLRDDAVTLALQVDGKPLSDDVIDAVLGKHKLTAAQRVAIKKFWRVSKAAVAKVRLASDITGRSPQLKAV